MSNNSTRILDKVYDAITRYNLSGTSITVAVSGGPDSLAMLDILLKVSDTTGTRINVAHLNHGIRGNESEEDAEFVRKFCDNIGVPCFIENRDVPKIAKTKSISLETAARIERHIFLCGVATNCDASVVALGHTLDDQAESILMHLIRGSGLNGLQGMRIMSHRTLLNRQLCLFRPLLSTTRDQTQSYCLDQGLHPRTDSTNSSLDFTRNSLRLKLIPLLESYNPSVKNALFRLSKTVSRDLSFMKKASEDAWDLSVSENNGVIKIDTEVFNHLPAALTYRILKRGLETVKGSSENISQIHLESMLALARNISGSSINLPGKITATKLYKVLIIHKSNSIMTTLPAISSKTKLLIPGVTVIPGWRIVATLDKAPRNYVDNKKELGGLAWLNINVAENISVRKREPGDIFQPTGMKNSRKIQDFMIDKKIPKDCRDRIPILETDKGIAWIVGWRTANWTIPTPGNESLKVKFKRITE